MLKNIAFHRWHGLALAAITALIFTTLLVYWQGLTGPLLLDDAVNLSPMGEKGGVRDLDTLRQFVFGNESGPLGRPAAMLSFLIDAQNWPPVISAMKYTNILLHTINALLLSWFALIVFGRLGTAESTATAMALICAALWALHPLNVSTTLYVVQRMTELMTMFALGALILFCKAMLASGRSASRSTVYLMLSLFPFGLLALLSKENGALVLLLMVVLRITVFRDVVPNRPLALVYRAAVVLPLLLVLVFLVYSIFTSLDQYAYRPFSPMERLLTESRVLMLYLANIFNRSPVGLGLFHDDIPISTSLFSPLTTFSSVVAIIALLGAAWKWRRQEPVFALAVFWFFAMHLSESTLLPLELYFEHRNYPALIGPLLAIVWYLRAFLTSPKVQPYRWAAISVMCLVVTIMAWTTSQLAALWGNTEALYVTWAEEHPDSVRAQSGLVDYLLAINQPEAALGVLRQLRENHPQELRILVHMWITSCDAGLPPDYSLQEIAAMPDLENNYGNINIIFRNLLERVGNGRCSYANLSDLPPLFDIALALPQRELSRLNLHRLYSELYVFQRDLNGAISHLDDAFAIEPLPNLPMRQATLAASAGLYEEALYFLEQARAADAAQSGLTPSVSDEIDNLEEQINSLLLSAAEN